MASVLARALRWSLPLLSGWTALIFSGCAAVRSLDPVPGKPVDLAGNWSLDHQASDNTQPLLAKLRPKPGVHRIMPDDIGLEDPQTGQQGGQRGGRRGQQQQQQPSPQMVQAYRNNVEACT